MPTLADIDTASVHPTADGLSRDLWVVVPTYNEAENVAHFAARLHAAVPDARLLIVDDNSPDGTGRIAERLAAADPRVQVLHRVAKGGLGPAYRAGFADALLAGADVVVQMDCDLSHAPESVPHLRAGIDDGADLVIGSRYVPGGSTVGWGMHRKLISRGGTLTARALLGIPLFDLTGGFKAWRASLLRSIDLESVATSGYGFQIETTWRAHGAGARIAEVPIIFRERVAGASKMSGAIIAEALLMLVRLRRDARRPRLAPMSVRS